MHGRQRWLVLAILGAVVPLGLFGVFLAQDGFDLGEMVDQLSAPVALAVLADLTISSVVFWLWMWPRARTETGRSPWLFLVGNLLVGLSFALPLFLYFRSRDEARADG
jgi:hypothetical protein